MIYMKSYSTEKGHVIAMCDEGIIGKILEDGALLIDLKTYAGFYKGELLDEGAAAGKLKGIRIYSANVIGKEAVGVIKKEELAKDSDIRMVNGVPFVQIYKVDY